MEKPILNEWARFAEDAFGDYKSIFMISITAQAKQVGM
jgi:hypothetical protein